MSLFHIYLSDKICSLLALIRAFLEDGLPESLLPECPPPTDWCQKSNPEAQRLRNLGNESYRKQDYGEALKLYSKSIASAPRTCEELALGFGNRSAVLLALKDFELCLLDTNRALKIKALPENSRKILLERKTKAWKGLKDQNDHRLKLKKFIERKKKNDNDPKIPSMRTFEKKICYISQVCKDDVDLTIDRSLLDDPVWSTKLDNVLLPNVSSKLKLNHDETWGRHFVATKNIDQGEVLFIDNFYSIKVNEDAQHHFCGYCTVWCEALIPCPNCNQEMYCCTGCLENAYNSYHRTECMMLPLMHSHTKEERERRLLALRMFLIGTKQGSELTKLMDDPKVYAALDGKLKHVNEPYSMKDYLSMLNLHWQIFQEYDAPPNFLVMKEVFAILVPLRCTSFFTDEDEPALNAGSFLTDKELFAVTLLAHHFSLVLHHHMESNAWFMHSMGGSIENDTEERVGNGVGTWQHFLNHSCDPNTMEVFERTQTLHCSLRPIKKGEQLSVTYGVSYLSHTLEERKHYLKANHDIDCVCRACQENWPLMDAFLDSKEKYHNDTNSNMRKIIQKKYEMLLAKTDFAINKVELEKLLGVEFMKTIRDFVKEPSPIVFLCEQCIVRLMQVKGNVYFAPKMIAALKAD